MAKRSPFKPGEVEVTISATIGKDLKRKLDEVASRQDRSLAAVIRRALESYIEDAKAA